MPKSLMRDIFDPKIRFSLMEDTSGEVDGKNILAKVKGEFFFPDGVSRNNRFYPREAWEKALENESVKSRLDKRTMFGTIGHDQELNDKAIREGMISHFMTSIYIDDNGNGIGEAYIMGTPTGQILNTVLRAGSQLAVSSRADGKFRGHVNNVPAIDPNNFILIGWDFVIDPGFLKANPVIAEAYNKTVTETLNGDHMADESKDTQYKKLVEHITTENTDLKTKNGELTSENTSLRESNTVVNEENKNLKEQIVTLTESSKQLIEFQKLGTVGQITEALAGADKALKLVESYTKMGTIAEIQKAFQATADHTKFLSENFGTVKEIKKVFEAFAQMQEELSKIGSIPEIKKLAENFKVLLEEAQADKDKEEEEKLDKDAKDLAEEVGADKEDVKQMLKDGDSKEEIQERFKKVTESVKKKLGIKPVNENKQPAPKQSRYTKPLNEDKGKDKTETVNESVLVKSRIQRINEKLEK